VSARAATPRVWRPARDERGIALLIVILTIALLTIVVVEFTQSAEVETHFAISSRNGLQAYYVARSALNAGEALVAYSKQIQKVEQAFGGSQASAAGADSLKDAWARPMPPIPIGDGTASFRVQDEGRRLNVNGMLVGQPGQTWVNRDRRKVFENLFARMGIDMRVLAAIVDWLDRDHEVLEDLPGGAEAPYYLGLTPPVTVRDGPLYTMRELLQVRGVTPRIFAQLDDVLTVLPSIDLKINVNTAPPQVLAALCETLDKGILGQILAAREESPFTSTDDLGTRVTQWNTALARRCPNADQFVDVKSRYFRIDAVGQVNDVTRGITELVLRDDSSFRTAVKRVRWAPTTVDLSLTSPATSDLLDSLPPVRRSNLPDA
jgi:general secretion pathway protein K